MRWSQYAPHILLALWLSGMGMFTWNAASRSVIPPIWDQESYYDKAEAFWQKATVGKLFNPLEIEPVVRPPGTVLVAYPMGFDPDPRAFYFRTVFIPVILFVAAIYLAASIVPMGPHQRWLIAVVAAFFASMPMFWQFEVSDSLNTELSWGMVDTFFGAMAALSAAALFRSASTRSILWFAAGITAAALCPLIKPVGMLISGLLGLCWVALAVGVAWSRGELRVQRRQWLIYALACIALSVVILLGTWIACWRSSYLSPENIAFGKAALEQLRQNWMFTISLSSLVFSFHSSVGFPAILVLAVASAWNLSHSLLDFRGMSKSHWFAPWLCGLLLVIVGVALWYRVALFRQIRYIFPFVLPAIILFLPSVFAFLASLRKRSALFVSAVLLLPAMNLAALAAWNSPPVSWQYATGACLAAGTHEQDVSEAYRIVYEAAVVPRLYSMMSNAEATAFEAAYGAYIRKRFGPRIFNAIRRPLSWKTESVLCMDDLICSDYIALTLPRKSLARMPQKGSFLKNFEQEMCVFNQWLASEPPPAGVDVAYQAGLLRLMHVENRQAFYDALHDLINEYSWRPLFQLSNRPSWYAASEISADLTAGAVGGVPLDFGRDFRLHRLALTRQNDKLAVDAYIEALGDPAIQNWSIFVHFLGEKNQILQNKGISLTPEPSYDPSRKIRHYYAEFELVAKPPVAIGMGIYRKETGPLPCSSQLAYRQGRGIRIPFSDIPQTGQPN